MKKLTMLAAMLLSIGTQVSRSADRRNFWLLNNTGYTITRVYIAAHGTGDSWGEDVLGETTLPNSVGTKIYFSGSFNTCEYDFRIGYSNGAHQDYLRGRDLCSANAVQFNSDTNEQF
jgi:hypothetical protein